MHQKFVSSRPSGKHTILIYCDLFLRFFLCGLINRVSASLYAFYPFFLITKSNSRFDLHKACNSWGSILFPVSCASSRSLCSSPELWQWHWSLPGSQWINIVTSCVSLIPPLSSPCSSQLIDRFPRSLPLPSPPPPSLLLSPLHSSCSLTSSTLPRLLLHVWSCSGTSGKLIKPHETPFLIKRKTRFALLQPPQGGGVWNRRNTRLITLGRLFAMSQDVPKKAGKS